MVFREESLTKVKRGGGLLNSHEFVFAFTGCAGFFFFGSSLLHEFFFGGN